MTGSPVQRAVDALAARARRAYSAYVAHTAGCRPCLDNRPCPTGQELCKAWRQACRDAR